MQIKVLQNAAILWAFEFINLPYFIKIFVLSIFAWPFDTGFTVVSESGDRNCLPRLVSVHVICQLYDSDFSLLPKNLAAK